MTAERKAEILIPKRSRGRPTAAADLAHPRTLLLSRQNHRRPPALALLFFEQGEAAFEAFEASFDVVKPKRNSIDVLRYQIDTFSVSFDARCQLHAMDDQAINLSLERIKVLMMILRGHRG